MPHVCLANRISFPRAYFPSTVPWSFLCLQFLSFDGLKSPWIVREEWPFVVPTCCHCGFDCLSGQHRPRTQPFAHSHPCGWTFLLARLPDAAAGSLWAAAIRKSDWLCFWKTEQRYDQAWRSETICADFFPVERPDGSEERGLSLSFGLQKLCQNRLNCQTLSQERKLLSEEFNLGTAIYSIVRPLMYRNFFC